MRKIIERLKEEREIAGKRFVKYALMVRSSSVNSPIPDVDAELDKIADLNEAISVLENSMSTKSFSVNG